MALGRHRFSVIEPAIQQWKKKTRRRVRYVRLRVLIGAGIARVDHFPRGPVGSVTFSYASLKNTKILWFSVRFLHRIRQNEARSV